MFGQKWQNVLSFREMEALKLTEAQSGGEQEVVINCLAVTQVYPNKSLDGNDYTTISFGGESIDVEQGVDEINQFIAETLHGLHDIPTPEEQEELFGEGGSPPLTPLELEQSKNIEEANYKKL